MLCFVNLNKKLNPKFFKRQIRAIEDSTTTCAINDNDTSRSLEINQHALIPTETDPEMAVVCDVHNLHGIQGFLYHFMEPS